MRIKNNEDIDRLGPFAKKQIQAILKEQGGFRDTRHPAVRDVSHSTPQPTGGANETPKSPEKKTVPSRVMRTFDDRLFCPWPSPDPFVKVHQELESRYGRYQDGGLLVTEMIISGGAKDWRFDFALISPLAECSISLDTHQKELGSPNRLFFGPALLLLEADGFKYHKSLSAFKNDRAKQTHALKSSFLLKRITNEDATKNLDRVMEDIELILQQGRIYTQVYDIKPKGKTQSFFTWL